MRALTLTQPWCGLVASGIKLVENRNRPVIKNADIVRGPVVVALHASREIDERVYDNIADIAPELVTAEAKATLAHLPAHQWLRLSRITSAVIAVATVYAARYIGGCSLEHRAKLCAELGIPDQARWMFGPTSYLLRDVRALPDPVPCRGWQGFWRLTTDVESRVVTQLARSA